MDAPQGKDEGASRLAASRLTNLPADFFYLPNVVTAEEEALLLSEIDSGKWVQLTKRRLQVYPAQLTARNILATTCHLPEWLTASIKPLFERLGVFNGSAHGEANHVLINQYAPGEGIMPHEDGAAYAPITATISLGGHTVLNLYEKKANGEKQDRPTWRVLQEPRSLLVTQGEAYKMLLHGIDEVVVDEDLGPQGIVNWQFLGDAASYVEGQKERTLRTSLTCRDVIRVSKVASRILGRN